MLPQKVVELAGRAYMVSTGEDHRTFEVALQNAQLPGGKAVAQMRDIAAEHIKARCRRACRRFGTVCPGTACRHPSR
jgi:hypothetical protein